MRGVDGGVELFAWSDAALEGALVVLVLSCAGALAACDGAEGAAAACDGAAGSVVACAGAEAVGIGSAGGAEVIADDDGGAIGSLGAAAAVEESAGDEVAAGSLVALRSLSREVDALRWLRVEAVVVLFELDAFACADGARSTSFFTELLDFAGGVAGDDDSGAALGALGSLAAGATVVVEVLAPLVSATFRVADATAGPRSGFATTGCEAT